MSGDGSNENTVTFSVTDIPPDYAEMIREAQNPATRRSILPNASFTIASPLTFILTGTSNTGEKLPEAGTSGAIKVTPASSGTAYTFTHPLNAAVWDLTLTAYKDYPASPPPPPISLKPVLQGHCTVDLTNSSGTASFSMSTKGLTTPGTVKITGTVTDTDNSCTRYEIGIYNAYSGKLIDTYTDIDGINKPSHAEFSTNVSPTGGSFPFTYEQTPSITLNAGAYEYRMIFSKGIAPNFIPIGCYSDIIIVNPGNDLVQDIGTLDVLNKKPTDPENLRAYLVNGSEDTEGLYYYTLLTWDAAKGETNYELELTTYSDGGSTVESTTVYGFAATNPGAEDFLASQVRYEGTLAYGSTHCTLKLALGKVYDVKLCARNYVGISNLVARVTTSAGTFTPPPSMPTATFTLFDGTIPHINRMRLKYNLNGGTLDLVGPPPSTGIKGQYVTYDSYTGAPKPLLAINNASSAANHLTKGSPPADFVKWIIPNTGLQAPPNYDYKNVYVAADFGYGLEGTVTIPPLPDLDPANITITYDEDGGSSAQAPSPNAAGHLEIPKQMPSHNPTFIKVSFAPSAPYTDLHCAAYLTGGGTNFVNVVDFETTVPTPPGIETCIFSTATYVPQTFTLRVTAKNAYGVTVGHTYIIELY